MEGKFVDDHTFAGMLRVDLSSLETEPTDTFTCHMALDSIRFDNVNFTVADEKIYEGNWDFDLNVKLDTKDTQTVEVNEVNDDGVGLEKVVKPDMNCEYIRKTKARQTANTISQKSSMQTENAWTTPEILPTAARPMGMIPRKSIFTSAMKMNI